MPVAWFPKTRPGLRARSFSWPVWPVAAAPGQVLAASYRKFLRCSINRTFDIHAADGNSSDRNLDSAERTKLAWRSAFLARLRFIPCKLGRSGPPGLFPAGVAGQAPAHLAFLADPGQICSRGETDERHGQAAGAWTSACRRDADDDAAAAVHTPAGQGKGTNNEPNRCRSDRSCYDPAVACN